MCLQCPSHTGPAPAHGTCALPALTALALGCSAGNCLRPALGCTHFTGLSCSVSGTWVILRGADLVGPAFCALPRSEQLRQERQEVYLSFNNEVFGKRGCCNLSPPLSLPLGFLGVQLAHLLRWMLTVQNPKKSWLATQPACSLVDNASLGPRLPTSGSGCLSPEGDGLQPAISVQSFVPCAGLVVS